MFGSLWSYGSCEEKKLNSLVPETIFDGCYQACVFILLMGDEDQAGSFKRCLSLKPFAQLLLLIDFVCEKVLGLQQCLV